MSTTADAISKIKANRALLSSKANAFKFSGLKVATNGSTYNEEYLKSKFSPRTKLNIEHGVASEKQKQKMINWIFCALILIGIYFYSFIYNLILIAS